MPILLRHSRPRPLHTNACNDLGRPQAGKLSVEVDIRNSKSYDKQRAQKAADKSRKLIQSPNAHRLLGPNDRLPRANYGLVGANHSLARTNHRSTR